MWKIENYSAEIWLETCIVLFKYRFSCEKKKIKSDTSKWFKVKSISNP